MTSDFCYPAEKGFQVWTDAIRQIVQSKPVLNY